MKGTGARREAERLQPKRPFRPHGLRMPSYRKIDLAAEVGSENGGENRRFCHFLVGKRRRHSGSPCRGWRSRTADRPWIERLAEPSVVLFGVEIGRRPRTRCWSQRSVHANEFAVGDLVQPEGAAEQAVDLGVSGAHACAGGDRTAAAGRFRTAEHWPLVAFSQSTVKKLVP